jgi:hypothetical protein
LVWETLGKRLRILVLLAFALAGISPARADEPVFGFILHD